jgi:hypothetical protein
MFGGRRISSYSRTERGGDVLVAGPNPSQGDEDIASPRTIPKAGRVHLSPESCCGGSHA